jgi:hypothetical protein
MKSIALPLIFLFFLPLFCLAQANYQPGVIVNLKGDTLHGFIDFREWDKEPTEIKFKSDTSAQPVEYTARQIQYFNVSVGYLAEYQRYGGRITMDETDINKLMIGRDTSYLIDTVFFKIIQRGKNLTLFSFSDNVKTRYYISEKPGDVPQELVYRIYYYSQDESGYSRTKYENVYQYQLYSAAVKANVATERFKLDISRASYEENSILPIVSKINGIDDNDSSRSNRKKTRPIYKIVAVIAVLAIIIVTINDFASIKSSQ